jgi:hypothetical protein
MKRIHNVEARKHGRAGETILAGRSLNCLGLPQAIGRGGFADAVGIRRAVWKKDTPPKVVGQEFSGRNVRAQMGRWYKF